MVARAQNQQKPLERSMIVISSKRALLIAALTLAAQNSFNPFTAQNACAKSDTSSITVADEQIADKQYQISKVIIKARPEQVWNILTDYTQAPSIFSTLKKCHIVADKGGTKIVHHVLRPTGLMNTFEYDIEVKEQPHKMVEWHRVSGDFKAVDGFWRLDPVECGRATLVTYASYVNGGLFMPQALIKRQARIDVPQVMASLRDHAERTMNIASHGHQLNQ